ncbi:MAG TPA: response regulator [Caulobacteraceae bacterium]
MEPPVLLVIDDDADVLKAAAVLLSPGARVQTAQSPEAVFETVAADGFDAVLLDMNFAPGERNGAVGLDWLGRFTQADPALAIVLMTTYGGVALAVEALKRGAMDFVLKPWRNEALSAAMSAAVAQTRARRGGDLNLDEMERRAIEQALQRHKGNVSQAAAALGLTRPALYRRMARHGL